MLTLEAQGIERQVAAVPCQSVGKLRLAAFVTLGVIEKIEDRRMQQISSKNAVA